MKWQTFIPLLVPVLIAWLKILVPKLPKKYLPVLAPVLGAVMDCVATGGQNPALAAALGSAGVGLREIYHQMRKGQSNEHKPMGDPPSSNSGAASNRMGRGAALVLLLPLCLLFLSCRALDPRGPYQGDQLLYQADQTLVTAYDAIDTFLRYERDTPNLPPAVHALADKLRANAPGAFRAALAARDAYARFKTDAPSLRQTLEVLTGLLAEISNLKSQIPK
jgi:hypothetical protein